MRGTFEMDELSPMTKPTPTVRRKLHLNLRQQLFQLPIGQIFLLRLIVNRQQVHIFTGHVYVRNDPRPARFAFALAADGEANFVAVSTNSFPLLRVIPKL